MVRLGSDAAFCSATNAESGISSSSAHCASEAYCVGKLMSSMPLCSSTSIWRRKLS
ncbi:MAG: hypothetical protein ACLRSE_13090 [Alistipes finegoldii]